MVATLESEFSTQDELTKLVYILDCAPQQRDYKNKAEIHRFSRSFDI